MCADINKCGCQPELEDELRYLGLEGDALANATEVILEHISSGNVKEMGILMKLLKKDIGEDLLLPILEATRKAFVKHQAHNTTIYQSSSESDDDEIKRAVRHTLKLYRKSKPTEEEYAIMATKIQASYRAYEIRRCCELKRNGSLEKLDKITNKNVNLVVPNKSYSNISLHKKEEHEGGLPKTKMSTVSSTSLAGSYLNLPKYRPYCAHDYETIADLEEMPEKEHAHIDYTSDRPHLSIVCSDTITNKQKKISFQRNVDKLTFSVDESSLFEDESESVENALEILDDEDNASVSTDLETLDTKNEEERERWVDSEMTIGEEVKEPLAYEQELLYEVPEIDEEIQEAVNMDDDIEELMSITKYLNEDLEIEEDLQGSNNEPM